MRIPRCNIEAQRDSASVLLHVANRTANDCLSASLGTARFTLNVVIYEFQFRQLHGNLTVERRRSCSLYEIVVFGCFALDNAFRNARRWRINYAQESVRKELKLHRFLYST